MRSTLILALSALVIGAYAQVVSPPTSIETVTTFSGWSLKSPNLSGVVTQRIGILHDILGVKGTYLDWRAFGGWNISQHNVPAAGFTLAGYFQVAKEVTLGLGPVFEISQQNRPTYGVFVGLQFNLK